MKKDYTKMTTEELESEASQCLAHAAMFIDCRDGSHGLALHNTGYYAVMAELKEREDEKI